MARWGSRGSLASQFSSGFTPAAEAWHSSPCHWQKEHGLICRRHRGTHPRIALAGCGVNSRARLACFSLQVLRWREVIQRKTHASSQLAMGKPTLLGWLKAGPGRIRTSIVC